MNLPKPQYSTFSSLLNDIEKGIIKIPQFQRDFVWSLEKSASLIDSILKGYPIGTVILWKTKERMRSVRNLGDINLPEPPNDDYIQYVLDGQQRITSVFAALKGLCIKRDDKVEDFSKLYVYLEAEGDEQIVITETDEISRNTIIKLTDLMFGGFELLASFPKEYYPKMTEYIRRIQSYPLPTTLVEDITIEEATEIFTRINLGGKSLSVFEIMVAKTFDVVKDFDLSEKYNDLIADLGELDYETIPDSTVLQTVAVILKKDCSKKTILRLEKDKFINIWKNAIDAIERAVEYFRNYYRIPVSQLLPYNALIIPFSYYFYHHKDKPKGEQQRLLEDFFWRTSLSERYSHSLESKMAQDIGRIDDILNYRKPIYDYHVDTSPESIIENGGFSAGRSYIKSILCLYAYFEPKSFLDNSKVQISNYWLKQANSKNYHHFFSRAYLKKNNFEEYKINNILNITIVDDYMNKREIGAKAPSVYINNFCHNNQFIYESLKTHLIGDINEFGICNDDYDTFIKERANAVSIELEKRIIR